MAVATPADAAAASPQTGAGVGGAVSAVDPNLVAGYLATPAGGVSTASLRFKVPTVKCKGSETRAVSVGLGDVQDLEAPRLRAHVILTCPDGGPAEYEIAAQACSHFAGPLATNHGHKVSVTLAQSGGTVTTTVIDETEGTTLAATDSTAHCDPPGPVDSVLFGAFPVFDPTLLDVPDFNKVKSRDATLNGEDLSGEKVNRQTNPGIRTSKLRTELSDNLSAGTTKSGDSFSLRYRKIVHCCVATPSPAGAPQRVV